MTLPFHTFLCPISNVFCQIMPSASPWGQALAFDIWGTIKFNHNHSRTRHPGCTMHLRRQQRQQVYPPGKENNPTVVFPGKTCLTTFNLVNWYFAAPPLKAQRYIVLAEIPGLLGLCNLKPPSGDTWLLARLVGFWIYSPKGESMVSLGSLTDY